MAQKDGAKLTDGKIEPTRRTDVKWEDPGTPTVLVPEDGTGGFLIIRQDPKAANATVIEFHIQIYVSPKLDSFRWSLPANENKDAWSVVDVPRGFSINNGESLVKAMKGPGQGDPPVIVHGHP